jgi:hypothetical protein
MAFSATVRATIPVSQGYYITLGDWSGVPGDAAGTLTVSGGYPVMVVFQKFDTKDNTYEIIPRIEVSVSGQITTITIENQDTVVTGRFAILHGGR